MELTANELSAVRRTQGSNPCLSAKQYERNQVCREPTSLPLRTICYTGAMKKKRTARSRRPAAPKAAPQNALIFSASDSHDHPKNQLWYLGISILSLAALAALFQAGEYLLMLVVVALTLAVFRLAGVGAKERTVRLTDRGLTYGDEFFPYFQLRAFWLAENDGAVSVYIERLNLSPTLHFIVPENRAEALVEFLVEHLPWHHHKNEPLGDRLGRLLRF